MAKKHEKITIEYAQERIRYYQHCISVLENNCTITPDDTLDEIIFKLYAKHQSVAVVNNDLPNYGQKRFSTTADISQILSKHHIEDQDLEEFVKNLQKTNHTYANRW